MGDVVIIINDAVIWMMRSYGWCGYMGNAIVWMMRWHGLWTSASLCSILET